MSEKEHPEKPKSNRNILWPTCVHGYYITPCHKCPWCAGTDTSNYVPVTSEGNGWLLKYNDLDCLNCGGPVSLGALISPEIKNPIIAKSLEEIAFCYSCCRRLKLAK